MTNRRFFSVIAVMFLLFTVAFCSVGCVGSSKFADEPNNPAPSPEPNPTPVPMPDPSPTPELTPTPTPTPEPEPSPEPTPNNSFIVTFDSNGGTEVPSQQVEAGSTVTMPDAPILDKYIFSGWYTDNSTFKNMFLFGEGGDVISEDITLYAQWLEYNPNALTVAYVLNDVEIGYSEGDNPGHVTDDLTLTTNIDGFDDTTITWSSSNSSVIATDGKVTRPSVFDANVTLTVTVARGDSSESREYQLNVIHAHTRTAEEITNRSALDIEYMTRQDETPANIIYSESGDRVVNIDGRFSDIEIQNADDALDSLQGIHTILGLASANDELSIAIVESNNYGSQYTFNQYYGDYIVWGRSVTAAAQPDGTSNYVVSHVIPTANLDAVGGFSPSITQNDAEGKALENYENAGNLAAASGDTELVIYTIGEYETDPVLVYIVHVQGFDGENSYHDENVFVNADDGSIINTFSNIHENRVRGQGKDETGKLQTFDVTAGTKTTQTFIGHIPVQTLTPTFFMRTDNPNIQVYNYVWLQGIVLFTDPVEDLHNQWDDGQQISAYVNMQKILNWWAGAPFYRNSLDGKGSQVKVVTHARYDTDNASWNGSLKEMFICDIGNSTYKYSCAAVLDILTHESTHAVVGYMMPNLAKANSKAPGAINEGYADVFGCLRDRDWKHGCTGEVSRYSPYSIFLYDRNIEEPNDEKAFDHGPSVFTSYDDIYGANAESSDGYRMHYYSFLVSHAAYLMWKYAGGDWDTLARLWYESLKTGTLNKATANFHTVREALLRAAIKNLKLNKTWRDAIRKAFDEEHIYAPQGIIKGNVTDVDGNKISGASVSFFRKVELPDEDPVTELPDKQVITAVGVFEQSLDVEFERKTYGIKVSAAGYETFEGTYSLTANRTTNVDIVLVKDGIGTIDGIVTSATTAEPLSGVTVVARSGWNTETGTAVKTVSTNASGFYTVELDAGYYTLEFSKNDYTTAHVNVTSVADQQGSFDTSLSPLMAAGKYRAVLRWAKDPRDLDSHLVCILPGGSQLYHIYYPEEYMNAYDAAGKNIANLDVDDVTSYGPETLTFDVDIGNTYIYYVHWYEGEGTWAGSAATVSLYRGSELVALYNVPHSNRYGYKESWNVFKISNGILTGDGTIPTNPDLETNSSVSSPSRVSTSVIKDVNVPIYYPPKNY